MTALVIVLIILSLIALVFCLRFTFEICISDGDAAAYIKVLFLKFRLFQEEEKKINKNQFKIKRFRKMRLKEEKKAQKNIEKKSAKSRQNQNKLKDKLKNGKKQNGTDDERKSFGDKLEYYIDFVRNVVFDALAKFRKHLVVRVYYVDISVGGEVPDKTAVNYGLACQGVAYISEMLNHNFNLKLKGNKKNHITVHPDFISEKSTVNMRISLSIRTWQTVSVLISGILGYFKIQNSGKSLKDTILNSAKK